MIVGLRRGLVTCALILGSFATAMADNKSVAITSAGGTTQITGDTKFKAGDTLSIACPAGTTCTGLVVKQGLTPLTDSGAAGDDAWTATLGGAGDVTISYGGKNLILKKDTGTGPQNGTGTGESFVPCPTSISEHEILIDTDGNVLANQLSKFSEEDKMTVFVIGPETAFAGLTVKRRSAFRDVTVLRILGNAGDVTGNIKEGTGEPPVCKRFELADFSAGRGVIGLVSSSGTVSEVEVAVRARYHGMFTVAFVATWLEQPTFSLQQRGAETVIAQDPLDDLQGRYALMYTAFVPLYTWFGFRNNPEWNQRLGVSAGVVLDDPKDNILFGVNLGPVNGFSIVSGLHLGNVQRLNGANVGDVVAADSTIPVGTKWTSGFFIGASLDISVATKLFFGMFK